MEEMVNVTLACKGTWIAIEYEYSTGGGKGGKGRDDGPKRVTNCPLS